MARCQNGWYPSQFGDEPNHRLPRARFLFGLALLAIEFSAGHIAADDAKPDDFETTVRPFLAAHCERCHGLKSAKSGFRIDQLSRDFTVAKSADHWKEVMDRINLGEMPPEDEPQPKAAEFEPVVRWINSQLRELELASRNAGGRIPMRRLNRNEYANSVRDLLSMDPKVLAPLVEDLPGDGKAEGFDRPGVALFFDETQMERTLDVAEQIAARAIVEKAIEPRAKQYEFENNPRVSRFKNKGGENLGGTLKEVGPSGFELLKDGVRFVHGYGNRPKGDAAWGRLGGGTFDEVITQDGYYRIRIRAGANRGARDKAMKVKAVYAVSTPVEFETEIPITASLDDPDVHETVVFLRSGPEGLRRGLMFYFNDISDSDRHDAGEQSNQPCGSSGTVGPSRSQHQGHSPGRRRRYKSVRRNQSPGREMEGPTATLQPET